MSEPATLHNGAHAPQGAADGSGRAAAATAGPHILLVKLSSLGDIVHTLPAVEDAARLGATFDWAVEEDFAAVPALHRAVRRVIPAALRRWRKDAASSVGEALAFRRALRHKRYDLTIDAQGLLKSAVVARLARSAGYAGFDRGSARESAATLLYSSSATAPRTDHAVDRIRALFATAIGYQRPREAPAFGLTPLGPSNRYCVLTHGTTWHTKHWPESFWSRIAERAVDAGLTPLLPWLSTAEHDRARRIAGTVPGSEVAPPLRMDEAIALLSGARAVVGVDSGLAHLAAALGRPTVVVYGPTDQRLTGCLGARARSLQASLPCSPCLARTCRYRGTPRNWAGQAVRPPCFASVHPDRVWEALAALLE